jgi:ACS family pantothenate transporter-like MFS transporter
MSWEVYALSILALLALLAGDSEMFDDNAILNQYLKYLKTYSVEQINYVPTAVSGIAIVANLLFSWYADWFKGDDGRTHVGILLSITGLISGAIMLNPPSVNAKLFALFSSVSGVCFLRGPTISVGKMKRNVLLYWDS